MKETLTTPTRWYLIFRHMAKDNPASTGIGYWALLSGIYWLIDVVPLAEVVNRSDGPLTPRAAMAECLAWFGLGLFLLGRNLIKAHWTITFAFSSPDKQDQMLAQVIGAPLSEVRALRRRDSNKPTAADPAQQSTVGPASENQPDLKNPDCKQ